MQNGHRTQKYNMGNKRKKELKKLERENLVKSRKYAESLKYKVG